MVQVDTPCGPTACLRYNVTAVIGVLMRVAMAFVGMEIQEDLTLVVSVKRVKLQLCCRD